MLTRRSAIHRCVLAGLWFVIGLGGRQLSAPTALYAQADSSGFQQRAAPRPPAPAEAGKSAARELFRQHCGKCHGADGTGSPARGPLPDIPDFTAASWQARRSEAQLLASILDGKGPDMPTFRRKISEEQARGLVAHVRAFAPAKEKSGKERQEGSDAAGFDERFRRLQEEMDELRRQFHELPKASSGGAPSKPSESRREEVTDPPAPAEARRSAARELFRQHCGKCHGADGTGSPARGPLPDIPDFTAASWQARRSEAQLLASILDGKGPDMPTFRRKISEEQARGLVAHVRAFAPAKEKSGKEEEKKPVPDEPVEAEPPGSFVEVRTRRWFEVALPGVAVLVLVTGFFGGAVVFGPYPYTWPP